MSQLIKLNNRYLKESSDILCCHVFYVSVPKVFLKGLDNVSRYINFTQVSRRQSFEAWNVQYKGNGKNNVDLTGKYFSI